MKAADIAILQLLSPPKRLELTRSNIARNTGLSRGYTSQRLKVLVKNGLVERINDGHSFYSITNLGKRVVDREISADDVDELHDLTPDEIRDRFG